LLRWPSTNWPSWRRTEHAKACNRPDSARVVNSPVGAQRSYREPQERDKDWTVNYWIFTVTSHKVDDDVYAPEEIFEQRMNDRFWGLGEKTPNRKNLQKDDRVVFYIGTPTKAFAGTATLASASFELSESERRELGHGQRFYTTQYGVWLEERDIWAKQKSVEVLLPDLVFVENKEFWFSYFQGGVRQVREVDFKAITGEKEVSLVDQIASARDLESQAEFALETHLEDFIYQNWDSIDWGRKLKLYETDELNGRQFPAGIWSIDFLAVDEEHNELVVIELKRGKTSDSSVGQVLRYVSWVRENVAEAGQPVKGVLLAHGVDEELKYAVKELEDIEVKTYQVDFKLLPVQK